MDWTEPARVVMSHGTAAVLRVLAGADGPFSIRELAGLANVSPTRARQAVDRLADHGLIHVDQRVGSRHVRLNHEHLAAEPAIALATLRSTLLDRLRRETAGWPLTALHVSVFGSAARGDGGTASDLDILVVQPPFPTPDHRERWDDQLAGSGSAIHRWTGNWVSWFELDEGDLHRMTSTDEPIVEEWRRDGITLFGPSVHSLLRGRRDSA